MTNEIAVFLGETGTTGELTELGELIIFARRQKKWQPLRKMKFSLADCRNIRELRERMAAVRNFLAECKIFVGRSISGVPFFELEKAKVNVWEFSGAPVTFLDYVWAEEVAAKRQAAEQPKTTTVPEPTDLGNGCYEISLIEVQENSSQITSKQILLPFLAKKTFYELRILCSHVPPWLELDLTIGRLTGKIEALSDQGFAVTVIREVCH